jgi:hypothetical protein
MSLCLLINVYYKQRFFGKPEGAGVNDSDALASPTVLARYTLFSLQIAVTYYNKSSNIINHSRCSPFPSVSTYSCQLDHNPSNWALAARLIFRYNALPASNPQGRSSCSSRVHQWLPSLGSPETAYKRQKSARGMNG